jgi:acetyl/propionyl-CoA carboxylase alpha subunit
LICWGETRGEALLRMRRALDEYRIMGIKTNIPFHQRLIESPRFQGGQFDTKFVEERFSMTEDGNKEEMEPEVAAIIATLVAHQRGQQAAQVVARDSRDLSNWKFIGRWERMRR